MIYPSTDSLKDVREHFADLLKKEDFVVDKNGGKVIEITGASFVANEDRIFGEPNSEYVARELAWYESQSLYVDDIPGGPPEIWKKVSSSDGEINSNYGYLVFSEENHSQFWKVLEELKKNKFSRRATMIYNRPSIWEEYDKDGMSDFICTYAHQYMVRNDVLETHVYMRSNDAWAGYRNDWAWAKHVQRKLAALLAVEPGPIVWNSASLHVYDSQFYLVDHYSKTGETSITKKKYKELYPESKHA